MAQVHIGYVKGSLFWRGTRTSVILPYLSQSHDLSDREQFAYKVIEGFGQLSNDNVKTRLLGQATGLADLKAVRDAMEPLGNALDVGSIQLR